MSPIGMDRVGDPIIGELRQSALTTPIPGQLVVIIIVFPKLVSGFLYKFCRHFVPTIEGVLVFPRPLFCVRSLRALSREIQGVHC